MTALALFAATFFLVLFLGLQSLNVNGGHKLMAAVTSLGISTANIVVLKTMPEMLPIIRNLHAEGLIDGWRNVKTCKLINANDHK